jgi:uncharacterized protein YndB with AHSA1/START domain
MMDGTVVVRRTISATPAQVWAVLADGWLYPSWVVGASRMRDVERSWPAPGSKLHHSVGAWPLLLDDRTEVIGAEPQKQLRLKAHGWPAGSAEVLIELEASGPGTEVTIREDAVAGPAKLVPGPVRQAAVFPRNREALRRLAFLAEGREPA